MHLRSAAWGWASKANPNGIKLFEFNWNRDWRNGPDPNFVIRSDLHISDFGEEIKSQARYGDVCPCNNVQPTFDINRIYYIYKFNSEFFKILI